MFSHGLPKFWDEEGTFISENDYLSKLHEKNNDVALIDKLDPIIQGRDIFEVLDIDLFLFHETRKIILGLPPPSYNFHSNLDIIKRDLLEVDFLPTQYGKELLGLQVNGLL